MNTFLSHCLATTKTADSAEIQNLFMLPESAAATIGETTHCPAVTAAHTKIIMISITLLAA